MSITRLIAIMAMLIAFTSTFARSVEVDRSAPLTGSELVPEILTAAGVAEAELAVQRERVESEFASLLKRMGDGRPTYRKARRLHRILHREYYAHYDAAADGVHEILRSGKYNCLSATLLYGMLMRSMGYGTEVLEYPGHVLLRLRFNGRVVDVETTAAYGFDVGIYRFPWRRGAELLRADPQRPEYLRPEPSRGAREGGPFWQVSLEQALGFAWLNRAWRTLDAGDPIAAAGYAAEAHRRLPEMTSRDEGVRRLLARAFSEAYEGGEFEAAFEVARIDIGLFPSMTTSRDRILAAGMKRIEEASAGGNASLAADVLEELESIDVGPSLVPLQCRAWPMIAAVAVRVENWELARRAAEAYAAAERDEIESRRLADWVESRSRGEASADSFVFSR